MLLVSLVPLAPLIVRFVQRENTIRELQARIQVFEVAQAKHLKAMSRPIAVAIATAENRSLIDPTAWVASSDKSKSPPQPAEEDITVSLLWY